MVDIFKMLITRSLSTIIQNKTQYISTDLHTYYMLNILTALSTQALRKDHMMFFDMRPQLVSQL